MLAAHIVALLLAHGHHVHHLVCTHPFLTVSRQGVVHSTPVTCTRVR